MRLRVVQKINPVRLWAGNGSLPKTRSGRAGRVVCVYSAELFAIEQGAFLQPLVSCRWASPALFCKTVHASV
jgi:hypothetical protein